MGTVSNRDGNKGRKAVMRGKEGRHDWMMVGSWTVQENRDWQLQTDYGKNEKMDIGCWRTFG